MYIILSLLAALILYIILYRIGQQIIFRPQKKRWPLHLPFREIRFQHCSGVYLPAQEEKPTLLFFHGRGGNISHFESFAQQYQPYGYGIILFDYRGFGSSVGTLSQKNIFEDALSAVDYALHQLKISPRQLVLFGHSLGNAPALYVAHTLNSIPFKALVLQSPFLSTPDMALCLATRTYHPHKFIYKLARWMVFPFLFQNKFDNTLLTHSLTIPVWIGMSGKDHTIPWQMSHRLAQQIKGAHIYISPLGGHDEFAWAVPDIHQFLQQIS